MLQSLRPAGMPPMVDLMQIKPDGTIIA